MTISGVHRGEQRKLYDLRKEKWTADNKMQFLSIAYLDLAHKRNGRLERLAEKDKIIIQILIQKVNKRILKMLEKMDSYERFLKTFNIDKNELFEFGISETILPPIDLVAQNWEGLKKRIFNNGVVSIRGYGRDAKGTNMYIDMYKYIVNNKNVKKDATNNLEPQKIISRLTGYKRNINLFNYQVSHVFGKTKNIFLFEAPWNIALVPKIIDPFTGHETKGVWPEEYQEKFSLHAGKIYAEFIDEYNYLITKSEIEDGIKQYIQELKKIQGLTREIIQFEKDVMNELVPIK